jgi:hypothetical protein
MRPKARFAVISIAATLNILNVVFPPVESSSNIFTSRESMGIREVKSSDSGNFRRVPIWQTFFVDSEHKLFTDSEKRMFHSFRIEWAAMLSLSAIVSWTAWFMVRPW